MTREEARTRIAEIGVFPGIRVNPQIRPYIAPRSSTRRESRLLRSQ